MSSIVKIQPQQRICASDLETDEKGFNKLSRLLYSFAGINLPLNQKNKSLMSSRLASVLNLHGLRSYQELLVEIEKNNIDMRDAFIEALTTNTTHFFREDAHFHFLKKILPTYIERQVIDKNRNELRVWCSAASTGQEPYSILMILNEALSQYRQVQLKFIATDIDREVLKTASNATYKKSEVSGVSQERLTKFFEETTKGDEVYCRVRSEYRRQVRFARLNLVDAVMPFENKFDIIFCRNVLIYFDEKTCHDVISKQGGLLFPRGLLFIGHSECGRAKTPELKSVIPAVYEKVKS